MVHYDDIYEIAADNYGLVTTAEAKKASIARSELVRYTKSGRLERIGHGVYRLTRYIPTAFDRYAEAVALVGPGSYLYGESVLAMHEFALVNPSKISVATKRRMRRALPSWIEVVADGNDSVPVEYEGIPSQSIADAILACRTVVMADRLLEAAADARKQGFIRTGDEKRIVEELSLCL
jgi:predicted transcriptional regulator of viral defense system